MPEGVVTARVPSAVMAIVRPGDWCLARWSVQCRAGPVTRGVQRLDLRHRPHHRQPGQPLPPHRLPAHTPVPQRLDRALRGVAGVAAGHHPQHPLAQLPRHCDGLPRGAGGDPAQHPGLDLGPQPVIGDRGDVLQQRSQVLRGEQATLQGRQRAGQPCHQGQRFL
jgi:hypothetical protein